MFPSGFETAATARTQDRSLRRYVRAGRRLLDEAPCDRCKQAPATMTNGNGTGWCQRCSQTELTERRASFERLAEARRRIARAKAQR